MFICDVKEIKDEGNIKHIIFNKPQNFIYLPGHFVMISIKNNEGFIKRAFSLSSSPTEKDLMITVKLNDKGSFTPYLFNKLKINDELTIEGPYGKMILKEEDKEKNISLIASGTGIAPMRSIFKLINDNKIKSKIDIYYVTKTYENLLYKKEFELLKQNKNFNINIFLTQEKNENYFYGRIEKEDIKLDKDIYYICGLKDFVIETTKFLKENNIKDIRFEAW